jgi:polyisoprenoid-binding protein YceI
MKTRFLTLFVSFALALTANAADRALQIDKALSSVDIEVKATMDSFSGRLDNYEASILFAPDSPKPVAATFQFRFADLKTGKPKRDDAMLKWIGSDKTPDGRFELSAIETAPDGKMLARGKLTIHGVSQPVEFPITVLTQQLACSIDGEATIDTQKFELPIIRMMGMLKVNPLVKIRIHIQGTLPAL